MVAGKKEESYCLFWTGKEGHMHWEYPTKRKDEGALPQKEYITDMQDAEEYIRKYLSHVTGQIAIAKVRKIITIELVEVK